MKRAENCVDCKITHITFEGDSLVFQFAKSKSQQDGEEHINNSINGHHSQYLYYGIVSRKNIYFVGTQRQGLEQ